MRRTLAAVALAVLATGLPVADAKPKPPALAGITAVYAWGSASIDVTVPKGASLQAFTPSGGTPAFADFLPTGRWAAVALLGRGPNPVRVAQVRTARPDHCPSQETAPATPVGRCRADLDHAVVSGTTLTGTGEDARYPIPAGTYQLVVSGPPNTLVAAALYLDIPGIRLLGATRPVASAYQRVRAEDTTVAEADGTFTHKVARNAVAVVGTWHATSDGENGAYAAAGCVAPGVAGPLDPASCGARQAVEPAATRPALAFAEGGPSTNAKIGQTTHLTPVLKPGTYATSYRVRRAGLGPAAGAFVWWLQADALR